MITNQCKIMMALAFNDSSNDSAGSIPITALDGSTRHLSKSNSASWPSARLVSGVLLSKTSTSSSFVVGSGNTAPSADDYRLDNMITSGISASSSTIACSRSFSNNVYTVTWNIPITNTSNEDITIKEIGLAGPAYSSTVINASTSTAVRPVLLDRTLLSTPITIPPSETATITYTLNVDTGISSASASEGE